MLSFDYTKVQQAQLTALWCSKQSPLYRIMTARKSKFGATRDQDLMQLAAGWPYLMPWLTGHHSQKLCRYGIKSFLRLRMPSRKKSVKAFRESVAEADVVDTP